MIKHRSRTNFADIYASDEQGMNTGLDGSIYIRAEATPRVFTPPRVGTQGSSISDAAPSEDISASLNRNGNIAVNGGAVTPFGLASVAGLTTGVLIAAALETAINTALSAAGQDGRVWAQFAGGLYEFYSQSTGLTSAVVITDGTTLDLMAELNLGLANSGVEAAGTDDQDFLLFTQGGLTFTQPAESNEHRSGRFHSGIVKKKKMVEFDFDTYINMSGTAGDSIDTAVQLLWESLLGTKTTNAGVSIDFSQGLPKLFFTAVRVSTIFGEYFTGCYVKGGALSFPGDGPATCKYTGRGATSTLSGISQVNGAVAASATVIVNNGETKRYTVDGYVMVVSPDGRTIVAGADGTLKVNAYDDTTHTLTLSAAVTVADDGFVVPWDPGAVQQTGRDAVFTDLAGSFKYNQSESGVCATDISLDIQNEHNDRDNCFGSDHNDGFVAGNRMTATLSVTSDLSNEHFDKFVRAREFPGFNPEIILGNVASGRYLRIRAPKWIPAVPAIELPQNGTTPVTLEGILYQSTPGAKDPIVVSFR